MGDSLLGVPIQICDYVSKSLIHHALGSATASQSHSAVHEFLNIIVAYRLKKKTVKKCKKSLVIYSNVSPDNQSPEWAQGGDGT